MKWTKIDNASIKVEPKMKMSILLNYSGVKTFSYF